MDAKFMTPEEWRGLSAESRHKINVEYQRLVERAEKAETEVVRLREALIWYSDQTHYLQDGKWKLFSYDNLWQHARDVLKGGGE